jgi:hypothetical protein
MRLRHVSHLFGAPEPLLAATQSDQNILDAELMRRSFMPDDAGRYGRATCCSTGWSPRRPRGASPRDLLTQALQGRL